MADNTSSSSRSSPALSVRDRELFLAEPHIAALSVSAGEGRGPLTVPIWYQYAPGGVAGIAVAWRVAMASSTRPMPKGNVYALQA